MYFIRKIKKTKKQTEKSSFIVSLPRKLEKKIASYNTEISKRLANFSRFRYFYEDIENPKCFMITIWDLEIPPNGINDKSRTTTIQRSGKSSRYVIIPKKVCSKFGWGVGTELVIGFDDIIDEYVQGAIYKDDNCFMKYDMPGLQAHACIIKFQRYRGMKDLYRTKLAKRKEELAREESEAYWSFRHNDVKLDSAMQKFRDERRNLHRLVWNKLESMNLVAISYTDYVKLRADKERERKRKRKEFLKKRYGKDATWRYRKDMVRSWKYGVDWDSRRENALDDPDSYSEAAADDPETYGLLKPQQNQDSWYDEDESEDF
ncbi:MAG: hypothetical protein KGI33_08750 [Thaumarchaeota archaeon]|nr:hypothetical protein [Nitrososphaerota archaeon]